MRNWGPVARGRGISGWETWLPLDSWGTILWGKESDLFGGGTSPSQDPWAEMLPNQPELLRDDMGFFQQWVYFPWSGDSQRGEILSPRGHFYCHNLLGRRCYWHLVGGDQGCYWTPGKAQDRPHPEFFRQIYRARRLRNLDTVVLKQRADGHLASDK